MEYSQRQLHPKDDSVPNLLNVQFDSPFGSFVKDDQNGPKQILPIILQLRRLRTLFASC